MTTLPDTQPAGPSNGNTSMKGSHCGNTLEAYFGRVHSKGHAGVGRLHIDGGRAGEIILAAQHEHATQHLRAVAWHHARLAQGLQQGAGTYEMTNI